MMESDYLRCSIIYGFYNHIFRYRFVFVQLIMPMDLLYLRLVIKIQCLKPTCSVGEQHLTASF